MPFKSQAQQRFMYAKHPDMAAKWEQETPSGARLPRKLGKKRKPTKRSRHDD